MAKTIVRRLCLFALMLSASHPVGARPACADQKTTPAAPAGGSIFAAVREGNVETVRKLLEKNPKLIGTRDEVGRTALHVAAANGREGEFHRDVWYDRPVSIDVTLFEKDEVAGYLEAAGFEVERIVGREPYEFEYPTRRNYAFGRKPLVL